MCYDLYFALYRDFDDFDKVNFGKRGKAAIEYLYVLSGINSALG